MISLYLSQKSWLHDIPAGSKLLVLCVCSVLVLPVDSLSLIFGFLIIVLLLYFSAGQEALSQIKLLYPLVPFLLLILILHIWTGSLTEGLVAVGRLLAMILLANLVSMTSRMTDMMAAMKPVFAPLSLVGLPAQKVSIAVALMVRFAPVLFALIEALGESWKARSRRRPRWRLIAPFTIQALKMSDTVAEALQSRGGSGGIAQQGEIHNIHN